MNPPRRHPPLALPDIVVAVHTHLIIRADLDQAAASAAVREAMDDAVKAGVPRRVLARAVKIMLAAPKDRSLDDRARALIASFEGISTSLITDDDWPGAFLPPDTSRNLLPPAPEDT